MSAHLTECPFKTTAEGLTLYADVLLPADLTKSSPRPVLVWWHGGGLLQGTRKGTAPHLQKAPEEHNLIVVSADYRLAPQVRMPEILSDVADVLRWIQSDEFTHVTKGCADTSQVFVSGSSAGGWLALLAGSGLGFDACKVASPPRPAGVVAIYPISDLQDPFWNTKQRPVSYFPRIIDGPAELKENLDPKSEVLAFSALDAPRSVFYHYMIQEALLPSLLLDGTHIEPKAFSVAQAISHGTVTLPPTFIVHGSIDDKVPLRQATDVYEALQSKGHKDVELVVEEGKDHLYDREPSANMGKMYAFIARHCHTS